MTSDCARVMNSKVKFRSVRAVLNKHPVHIATTLVDIAPAVSHLSVNSTIDSFVPHLSHRERI